MAPTITRPRLASHAPATSRKPSTLAGCVMPDSTRPSPNTSPESNALSCLCMSARSDHVAQHEHHDACGRHEDERREQRAHGETTDAADAVTAGAAVAEARAEAN